jgi:hypothetical protein
MVKEQRWPLAWVKTKMVSRSNDDDAEAAAELVEVGLVGGKSAGAKTSHSHLGSGSLVATPSHLIVCLTNFLSHSSLIANNIYENEEHLEDFMAYSFTRAVWICRSSRRVKSRVSSCRAIKYAAVRSEIISTSHSIFVPLCVAYETRYSRKEVYGSAREELMNCSHPVTYGFSV